MISFRLKLLVTVCCLAGSFSQQLPAQYGGPSILSRGGNSPGRRGRAPVDFTFYVSGRGLYETGLLAPILSNEGDLVGQNSAGALLEAGAYGGHDWKHSSLGLDYRGDYRYNNKRSYFNGFNQVLALDFTHQFNRRLTMYLSEAGGSSNRAFGAFAAPAFAGADRLGIPLNEVFDVRVYFAQSTAGIAYQKSARTTLSGSVQGFFMKRESVSLVNSQGYRATGQASYRLNSRDTIGFDYYFMTFEYPHLYTASKINGAGFRFSRKVSESFDFGGSAGLFRMNTSGSQIVQLSPEVAEILGRSSGLAAFRRTDLGPSMSLSAGYTQARGRYSFDASRSVGAGNGVLLTSTMTTVNTGYSYLGLRRQSLGASAGWTQMDSLASKIGKISSWQTGIGYSYRFANRLHFTSQFDYRTFNSGGIEGRSGFGASVGLSYSSSNLPLSIW